MNNNHMISIIMPTYNREKLLPIAINSILAQSYENWELIVVDDRSTDKTKELIMNYSKQDRRIRYILNDRTKGPSGARNCGIMHSKGTYIAFLDSDDEWLDFHLNNSLQTLENEKVDAVFSLWIEKKDGNCIKVGENERTEKKLQNAKTVFDAKDNLIIFKDGLFEYCILEMFWFFHINTMIFKKEVIETTGLFNEELVTSEDVDFISRFFNHFSICLINDYHYIYNQGSDNLYLFINRSNIDINKIIYDKKLVEKITFDGLNKIKMRKFAKEYTKTSLVVKNKSECLKRLDLFMSIKYFGLSYIHIKLDKSRAIYYCWKSILLGCSKDKLMYMIALIIPFLSIKIKVNPAHVDIF